MTSFAPTDDVVVRRVGPRQPPAPVGDRGTGLAADSHFASALITLWHLVVQSGGAVGFDAAAERWEVAPSVTQAVTGLRDGSWHAVVLTAGNELVGAAFLVPRSVAVQRHLADVRSLMIDPGYRRRGLGSRLVHEIRLLATELGVATLLSGVRERPDIAAFAASTGFVQYGRLPDSIRLTDGSSFAEVCYQRALRPADTR